MSNDKLYEFVPPRPNYLNQRADIFDSPIREKIELAMIEGQSQEEICLRYGVKRTTLQTHARRMRLRELPDVYNAIKDLADMGMTPSEISKNLPAHRVYGGIDMLEEIQKIRARAQELGDKAEMSGNTGQAISALREQLRIFQTMVQMADQMRRRGEFNPWQHPEIIAYQEGLLEILRNHPKAMEAVIDFIERYNSRPTGSAEEREAVPIRPDTED